MEQNDIYKVFTPTTTARLAFVEREHLNTKLVNALMTPGKQVVVYGHSGSGKTTLLVNKLQQVYASHLTSRCMKGLSFDTLILDAFDQLAPYYCVERTSTNKSSISGNFSIEYLAIKSQISAIQTQEGGTKEQRILPPQLTIQTLGRLIGQANSCWVLEDFHKIDESERIKLSQAMKIFKDMADEFSTLKIIAIGAVDTARQVVEYDNEMQNRVAEINVPLMSANEIEQIMIKGQELLNISFSSDVIKGIVSYSSGMASVCHHLCLNSCIAKGIVETGKQLVEMNESVLKDALAIYLDESSDTLKKIFDIAFKQERRRKYDNKKLIIKALSECGSDGAYRQEILSKIHNIEPNYPQGNLTTYLEQLCTGVSIPIIRLDSHSGVYTFSDPVYRVFSLVYFSENQPKRFDTKNTNNFDYFYKIFKDNFKLV